MVYHLKHIGILKSTQLILYKNNSVLKCALLVLKLKFKKMFIETNDPLILLSMSNIDVLINQ